MEFPKVGSASGHRSELQRLLAERTHAPFDDFDFHRLRVKQTDRAASEAEKDEIFTERRQQVAVRDWLTNVMHLSTGDIIPLTRDEFILVCSALIGALGEDEPGTSKEFAAQATEEAAR